MIDGAKLTQPQCWELAKDVTLGTLPRNLGTGLEQRGALGLSAPRVSLAHPSLLCDVWLQADPLVSTHHWDGKKRVSHPLLEPGR